MRASIIIPTFNGKKTINDCLNAVMRQQLVPDFEVVVVDSGSTDGTQEVIAKYPVIFAQINAEDFGHGKTRNFSATLAKGEFLVFLTQDAVPVNFFWLHSLLHPFEQDLQVGAVYSKQEAPPSIDPCNKFRMAWMYGEKQQVKQLAEGGKFSREMVAFSNVGSAIPRRLFSQYLFRDDMKFAEDTDLAFRLLCDGKKIIYEPKARLVHAHNHSITFTFKYCFDVAISYRKSGILTRMRHVRGEGMRYLWEEYRFLIAGKHYIWILYAFVFHLAQFSGFRIGFLEKYIPRLVKKHLSCFWY